MAKIYENEYGIYISHKKYVDDVFKNINDKRCYLNSQLFNITEPYKPSKLEKKLKKKDVDLNNLDVHQEYLLIKQRFELFRDAFKDSKEYKHFDLPDTENKVSAIEIADLVYKNSENSLKNAFGSNIGPAKEEKINGFSYYFPENSIFFSKNVDGIEIDLKNKQFDVILLDPPWWNKYIRRKRKKCGDTYSMMYNEDLQKLPLENLLTDNGFVVVWCTNSEQHYNDLITNIFPKWQVNLVAKWFWVKVTTKCEPICEFSEPPRKQPFEKIIFAARKNFFHTIEDGKLLVSIPSALHSHKPPLIEILQEFLPKNANCLEIFARYLVPGWTSYGNEVLRFQHEALFVSD